MMHASLIVYEDLINVRSRPADKRVGRTHIAFLVAAHANATAAWPAYVASCERDVHQRAVRSVIVIPPDESFFITEHRPASLPTLLGFNDPCSRLADLFGR